MKLVKSSQMHIFYVKKDGSGPFIDHWDVPKPSDWSANQQERYGYSFQKESIIAERFIALAGYNDQGEFSIGRRVEPTHVMRIFIETQPGKRTAVRRWVPDSIVPATV